MSQLVDHIDGAGTRVRNGSVGNRPAIGYRSASRHFVATTPDGGFVAAYHLMPNQMVRCLRTGKIGQGY